MQHTSLSRSDWSRFLFSGRPEFNMNSNTNMGKVSRHAKPYFHAQVSSTNTLQLHWLVYFVLPKQTWWWTWMARYICMVFSKGIWRTRKVLGEMWLILLIVMRHDRMSKLVGIDDDEWVGSNSTQWQLRFLRSNLMKSYGELFEQLIVFVAHRTDEWGQCETFLWHVPSSSSTPPLWLLFWWSTSGVVAHQEGMYCMGSEATMLFHGGQLASLSSSTTSKRTLCSFLVATQYVQEAWWWLKRRVESCSGRRPLCTSKRRPWYIFGSNKSRYELRTSSQTHSLGLQKKKQKLFKHTHTQVNFVFHLLSNELMEVNDHFRHGVDDGRGKSWPWKVQWQCQDTCSLMEGHSENLLSVCRCCRSPTMMHLPFHHVTLKS